MNQSYSLFFPQGSVGLISSEATKFYNEEQTLIKTNMFLGLTEARVSTSPADPTQAGSLDCCSEACSATCGHVSDIIHHIDRSIPL